VPWQRAVEAVPLVVRQILLLRKAHLGESRGQEQRHLGNAIGRLRSPYPLSAIEDAFQAHRRTPHFENIIELQVVPLLDERVWTRMEPLPNGPG
jgi:hypothetical protein